MLGKDEREILFEIFEKVNNNSDCIFPGDNEINATLSFDNDTSYSILENMQFVFYGVGMSLLALVGIPVNVLSVIVLTHPRMKSSLTTLLLGLTICDIFTVGTAFFRWSLDKVLNRIRIFPGYYTYVQAYLWPWIFPICLTAQLSSVYFTAFITLERYIAVCHPLKARSFCTRSAANRSFVLIVLFSILFNLPAWFEYETYPVTNCDNQTMWHAYRLTELGNNEDYLSYYVFWAYTIVYFVIPFAVLVYFNIVIYREVKKQRHRRSSISSTTATCEKNEDFQLAAMLLGIVITFLVCYVLNLVFAVMESFDITVPLHLITMRNFLEILSHSTNFIFYCAFGTRFRQVLMATLGIRRKRKPRADSVTESSVISASVDTTSVQTTI